MMTFRSSTYSKYLPSRLTLRIRGRNTRTPFAPDARLFNAKQKTVAYGVGVSPSPLSIVHEEVFLFMMKLVGGGKEWRWEVGVGERWQSGRKGDQVGSKEGK